MNPTGKFVIGGPMGDTGLTGRKIIVDTYGGAAGTAAARSPARTRPRSTAPAAYAARYVAKNVVAAGLADRCQAGLIRDRRGGPDERAGRLRSAPRRTGSPTNGTQSSTGHFDLRPGRSSEIDLRRPIYRKTAAYGHFGRADKDFTWERPDKADALRNAAGLAAPAAV